MSFTVTRYKDGKATPIRLSIWDAFKGAPTPRPRSAKPCSCCKQIHPKKPRKGKVVANPNATDTNGQNGNHDDTDKTTRSTKDVETYSKDDDAKIIDMKAAHKSWKDILSTINKESLSQVKEHWKTIDPNRNSNNNQPETNSNTSKASKPLSDAKKAEIERKKAEGQAKKRREKDGETQKDKNDGPGVVTNSSNMSASTSTELKTFADRHDKHKWMAAASRHFDLTGQRITAAAARKMAEGK